MARTFRRSLLVLVLALAALPASASAAAPPWCGTPEPDDSAEACPTARTPARSRGQLPAHPVLRDRLHARDIEDRSRGRMDVDVIGQSASGRDMYGVVINELRTRRERRDYLDWLGVRR